MTLSKRIYYSMPLEIYLLISSLVTTIFFGFIDEGFYNFAWMGEIVAVTVLLFYGLAVYIILLILFGIILKKYPNVGKIFSLLVSADLILWMIWLY